MKDPDHPLVCGPIKLGTRDYRRLHVSYLLSCLLEGTDIIEMVCQTKLVVDKESMLAIVLVLYWFRGDHSMCDAKLLRRLSDEQSFLGIRNGCVVCTGSGIFELSHLLSQSLQRLAMEVASVAWCLLAETELS